MAFSGMDLRVSFTPRCCGSSPSQAPHGLRWGQRDPAAGLGSLTPRHPPGSILRRWKRNWFVLYLDGSLVYYHDETQRDMDGRIHIKYSCRDVRTGRECRGEQSPAAPIPVSPLVVSPPSQARHPQAPCPHSLHPQYPPSSVSPVVVSPLLVYPGSASPRWVSKLSPQTPHPQAL